MEMLGKIEVNSWRMFRIMGEFVNGFQTHKVSPMPIVLYGRDYWAGMIDWIKKTMELDHRYISPGDLDLLSVVDSVDQAMEALADVKWERNGTHGSITPGPDSLD